MKSTTTKKIVWFCTANGVAWVYLSYLLAYLEKPQIAETLAKAAITEIIAVVLLYCLKSLFEKRADFGSVGAKENNKRDC